MREKGKGGESGIKPVKVDKLAPVTVEATRGACVLAVVSDQPQGSSVTLPLIDRNQHRTDETVAVRGKPLTPGGELSLTFLAENPAVSHNRHFRLWEEGAKASRGVQNFAEVGVTVELMKSAKEARKRRSVGTMYRTAGIPNGIGHSSTELLMLPRNSLLSLMVKVIPSPDWFVGVDSLNLCEGSQWKQDVTVDLQPYDAGTDSGFTFSSPNFPTSPPENISKITSQMPNHPANSFYYPRLKELPPIASIKITRQSRSLHRQVPMSNHILPNSISPQRFSVTPLDCEVSLWSSWGLCLGPCSKGGIRHRTRYILLRPANAGVPCPELEEQAECVPHSCMKLQ
uniref:Spondin 2a, extracellular matrix protein n=1 Tax=Hippocampus comes TaxID=109280 RepID=A0A3Q2Y3X8_HIPCM